VLETAIAKGSCKRENNCPWLDSDKDGSLLAQARKERTGSTLAKQSEVWFRKFPFRDSITSDGNKIWEGPGNLYPLLDRTNHSGIPVYMTTGWYDLFSGADDMFLWFANLTVPRRLLVRPADHSEVEKNQFDLDFGSEAHRWFDYWLKGIGNGIMKEPPIHYYLLNADKKEAWKSTDVWPLKKQGMTRYYFGTGETGGATSVNNGALVPSPSTASDASDAYTVDYSTTSGKYSRWYAVNWSRKYPDMRSNDKKALTYTTSPLQTDVEVTGHPLVHLWLRTDAPDLDAFVYLEEVDGSGKSFYITEGNLRASHRKLSKAPYNNLGLPYHSHYRSDLMPIPAGEPFELVFNLLSTSYCFHKGSHIRITVAFADADNFDTPIINPAPKLQLLRDMNHPSFIQLPIVQSR